MNKTLTLACLCVVGMMQTAVCAAPVKVYSHLMNPRQHPDDTRRWVKPPDQETFGNKLQFMALRSMYPNGYKEVLDRYVNRDRLGNIIWAHYNMLYNKNVEEQVKELKRRNLFLFDLWGFVPGSGPGEWTQFKVPEGVLEMFERELGDKWLGMDNGEQDGRYVGGYAWMTHPYGINRYEQYLNFQRHFQRLDEQLGDKMATLVSLNFGHYFLRECTYTLIGAETAQALPNAQVYYSFIRGAGKQYGVPWFGNVSVFNRWGWKDYPKGKAPNPKMDPAKGTSLALMKKLLYNQILYNSVAVGFESSFYLPDQTLSPIGKIQQSAVDWYAKYGDPGVMHTPVAVMVDFFSGWSYPRHLYTRDIYRVWGVLAYDAGDYLTDGVLDMFYPGYQDTSYFRDERGYNTPTPFGDSADCLLSDAPLWLLRQYPVLVLAGRMNPSAELKDTLRAYIRQGGHLVLTAANARALFPEGLAGITVLPATKSIDTDQGKVTLHEMTLASGAKSIEANGVIKNFAARGTLEKGVVTVLASPYAVAETPQCALPIKNEVEIALETPYPLLKSAQIVLADIFRSQMLFGTSPEPKDDGLSIVVCRRAKGEYTISVCNNTWEEKPFGIYPYGGGKILSMEELKTDVSERAAIGFTPETLTNVVVGVDSEKTIAAGAVRLFRIKTDEASSVEEIPFEQPTANPKGRVLALRDGDRSIKESIIARPTFFRHCDSVMIDWRYLQRRDSSELKRESTWIRKQGLRVMVDLTSGLNHYPDIRLIENDTNETKRVKAMLADVLDKMELIGAKDLVIARHRMPENNMPWPDAAKSHEKVINRLCEDAGKKGIAVYMRASPMRRRWGANGPDADWIKRINSANLKAAPSLADIMNEVGGDVAKAAKVIEAFKGEGMWFLSLPQKDLHGQLTSLHQPLAERTDLAPILDALKKKGCPIVFDAIYSDTDAEYRDFTLMER